jgi:Spy/CpxP family protein refolding chaperone
MNLQKILSDLTAEKDRIVRAIESLLESPSKRGPKKGVKRPRATAKSSGGLTPEGRRRLSLAMKKRWAERKRKKS